METTNFADYFNAFEGYTGDLPEECIRACAHPGPCDDDVEFWQSKLNFIVPTDQAIEYLTSTGGWTREELTNEDEVTLSGRVLWFACGDLRENLPD